MIVIKYEYEDTLVDSIVDTLVDYSIGSRGSVYGDAFNSEGLLGLSTNKQQEIANAIVRRDEHRVGTLVCQMVRDYLTKYHREEVEGDLESYL